MGLDRFSKAVCPKCRYELIYVTALPHPKAMHMRRTTFLCEPCNRTWAYNLSSEMADIYATNAPKMPPDEMSSVVTVPASH